MHFMARRRVRRPSGEDVKRDGRGNSLSNTQNEDDKSSHIRLTMTHPGDSKRREKESDPLI